MIEKNCYSCETVLDFMIPDRPCGSCFGWEKWQPSELYTAYLAEGDRADEWEAYAHKQKAENDRLNREKDALRDALSDLISASKYIIVHDNLVQSTLDFAVDFAEEVLQVLDGEEARK